MNSDSNKQLITVSLCGPLLLCVYLLLSPYIWLSRPCITRPSVSSNPKIPVGLSADAAEAVLLLVYTLLPFVWSSKRAKERERRKKRGERRRRSIAVVLLSFWQRANVTGPSFFSLFLSWLGQVKFLLAFVYSVYSRLYAFSLAQLLLVASLLSKRFLA